jgi:hypothetical protein
VAFTKCPRQLLFFGQPMCFFGQTMWLALLNAVLWAKPFMIPAPMIWGLAHPRQNICSSLPWTEKAPTIKGRGKLAERIEVEFGPFRPACIA